jgi:hypothetical protein
MPLREPGQEALPDFSTHPVFQPLFDTLVAGGQNREQATILLADAWCREAHDNAPQGAPQPPAPQHLDPGAPQQGHAGHAEPQPLNPGQPPLQPQHHQQPLPHNEDQLAAPLQDRHQGQGQALHAVPLEGAPAPQVPPPLHNDDHDGLVVDKADKRGLNLPPIDLEAESLTMSLQRPTTYAIERLRKGEYVPLWYFTDQGC